MFAIAGGSGRVGAATAEALLRAGQKVRVLVRHEAQVEGWQRRHAEAQVVDLLDEATLTRALTGMTGAFLQLPPQPTAADALAADEALTAVLVKSIKASRVERVVFLSAIGAQHAAGTGWVVGLHRAERALKGTAKSLTMLRPALLVENWAAFALGALERGELPSLIHTHHAYPQACVKDVGTAAAGALVDAGPGAHVLELAGKEAWSPEAVAAALGTVLGAPVKAVYVPPERGVEGFTAAGFSPAHAALWVETYQALARGQLSFAHPHGFTHGTTGLLEALRAVV